MARHAVKHPIIFHRSQLSKHQKYMSLDLGPAFSHGLEFHSLSEFVHASALEPLVEILTLTDIKRFELMATVDDSLDADSGNANTSPDGQLTQFK